MSSTVDITHSVVTTKPNNPNYDVSADAWNEKHVIGDSAIGPLQIDKTAAYNWSSTSSTYYDVLATNLLDKSAGETVSGAYNFSSNSCTIGGVLASNLVDKSAGETVSGAWNFSSNNCTVGGVTASNLVDKSASETITGVWDLGPCTSTGAYNFAGTTGTVGGVLNTNLVDKSAGETVSGAWNFSSNRCTVGGVTASNLVDKSDSETVTGAWQLTNTSNTLYGVLQGSLLMTPADHSGVGLYTVGTVGETVAMGDVLYMKSDGKFWKADADAAATMPGMVLAMVAITANSTGNLLHFGYFRDDTWNWTVGGLLYVSITPGNPTQTAPSGTGDQVQVVGTAVSADVIFFNPSPVLVEVA